MYILHCKHIDLWEDFSNVSSPRYNWNIVESGIKHHKSINCFITLTLYFRLIEQNIKDYWERRRWTKNNLNDLLHLEDIRLDQTKMDKKQPKRPVTPRRH
jgi:hypothetical protein